MKSGRYLRWPLWLVAGFLIVAALACTSPWPRREAGPSVVIDSPASGTTVEVGQEVTIQSTSTDGRGVTKVELWVDEALVHTDSSPVARGQTPFSVLQSWTPLNPREYTIVVKAYNVAGQVGESEAITLSAVEAIGEASPTPSLEAAETATLVVASPTPTSPLAPISTPTPTSASTPTGITPIPTETAAPTSTPTATPPAGPCLPTSVTSISVGTHPKGVAAGANRVYVGLHDAAQVKVIDRANNTVVDTWDTKATAGLGRYANGVAISHGRVYVANRNGNNVSAILISNHADVRTIPVGVHPFGVAAGSDYVFVANFDSESVTIIDSSTLATNTASVLGKPTMLATIGNNAYVASWSGGVYKVGSDGSVAQVVSADQGNFFGVAANPKTARVYISDQSDNSVAVLDTNTDTIVATISMPAMPHALAVNSRNNRIYIVAAAENKLYVLDGDINQLVDSVAIGQQGLPWGGEGITLYGDQIYVTDYEGNTVTVLDDSACD